MSDFRLRLAAETTRPRKKLLLAKGELPTRDRVKLLMGKDKPQSTPDMPALVVDLHEYDAHLGRDLPGLETGT